ncbi:MAG: DUF370 domain-containing protein [Dorea sp.]|nr:DUF370 domain-containing protein [Dorea sp.]
MEQMINIGFGNYANRMKIVAIVTPDSAPAKRMIQSGKDNGTVIDATQGRKTRAAIIMENHKIILSAVHPETLANRCADKIQNDTLGQ